jgi:hypothetical protein
VSLYILWGEDMRFNKNNYNRLDLMEMHLGDQWMIDEYGRAMLKNELETEADLEMEYDAI